MSFLWVFFLIFIFTLFCFTILYWFCHTLTWISHGCTWVPNPEPPSNLPPYIISLDHPSAPDPSVLCPVSFVEHRLVIHFLHDSIHVSIPFSRIIPPSPSESKSPFYTSVSLLLLTMFLMTDFFCPDVYLLISLRLETKTFEVHVVLFLLYISYWMF